MIEDYSLLVHPAVQFEYGRFTAEVNSKHQEHKIVKNGGHTRTGGGGGRGEPR